MNDQEFIRRQLERERRDRQEHQNRVNDALNYARERGVDSSKTSRPPSDATNNPRTIVPHRGNPALQN